MGSAKIHDEASKTSAEAGAVIVDGPDGVAVSLMPEAAADTADRLKATAKRAQDQRDGKAPPIE